MCADLLRRVCLPLLADIRSHVIRHSMACYKFFVPATEPGGGGDNTKHSPNFNIKRASWLPGRLKRQKFKWTSLPRDKTTWVLVKDELWLFLENEVLGLATGQTLNSRGWNYLKRRAWLMYLALVIEGVSFLSSAIDLWTKRNSCICESFCEKFTGEGKKRDAVRKLIFQYLIWMYCFKNSGQPGFATQPLCSLSPSLSLFERPCLGLNRV